ncbi:efflux RND transporter periplasmic adaptor subunit [Cohaesibacter haloalkalitolerans]|uniref:efflux RND transporter periplasmic adaptor subunit n=1 Tax=Cohaesibacter haloalkalitolerans TaxID=1162980 RepID=UPI000E649045|nr:efflux RND transporter periplasmic adaptor subunit [Cohaesibacter haloalkalitolerans]
MRKALPKRGTFLSVCLFALTVAASATNANSFTVKQTTILDKKAVYATVQSTDSLSARVRTSGTVTELNVTEGSYVKAGETIAMVRDPKLSLQIEALDAQISASERQVANLKTEKERAQQLFDRGSTTKAKLDTANTQFDVAESNLEANKAQKAVVVRQMEEGAVLAPQAGRVLEVPITVGAVVMTGESVATIAKDNYILRLSLPERHAQFLKKGDPIELADRGVECNGSCNQTGEIVKVYPEISDGRVLADATVAGLGDYFVGERIQVRVGAGSRKAYLVPTDLVFTRSGIDFVRVKGTDGKPTEVAVQIGLPYKEDGKDMIEILTGLSAGDELIQP